MDVMNMLPIHSQEEVNPAKPEDYIDEEGLLRCGVCGERKQYRIKMPGFEDKERVVPVICACIRKEQEKRAQEEEYRRTMERIQRLKSSSMMASKFRDITFDKYEVIPENKKVLNLAHKYVDRFPEMEEKCQGLLLYGTVGTGKSFTAACIANALLNQQISVVMTSFVKVLQDIRGVEDESQYMAMLNSPRLLIIDDLGAERNTDYALEKVYNIIDSRVRADKPMILTTNLELDEMMEAGDIRYQRIYDRIFEVCYPVEMSWKSFRRKTAAERFGEMQKLMEG